MIYLFSGDDAKNKLAAYEKFVKSIPKSTETFFVSRNDFDRVQTESFYSGAGLFFAKCAVIFSNIFDREETRDFVLEKLPLMQESKNDFIFLESKLNKPILDAFKKAGSEVNVFELPKEKKEKFDNFLVANAFGQRNKLNTWIYFRQAMDRGVGMEELVGVLFWKVKDLLLKNNFSNFSSTELKNFASRISYLLPEARKQGLDAESVFEQFLLEAF